MSDTYPGVCKTANYIAAARAIESDRLNHIIYDPWAREFAGEEGFSMLKHFSKYRMSSTFSPDSDSEDLSVMITAIRTKFIDTHIIKSLEDDNNIKQIIILGCGFDTRSCRLSYPYPSNIKIFEIDLPDIIKRREDILGTHMAPNGIKDNMPERAHRLSIPFDISNIDKLQNILEDYSFNSSKKSIWVLEGLLVYLNEETVHKLLNIISSLSPQGSKIMVDIHNPATLKSAFNKKYNDDWANKGAPLIWGCDYPEDIFRWHGFNTNICCRYGDKDANFGRYPSYLVWLLDSFPRYNTNAPNTVLYLGTRNDIHSNNLNEWKDFLKLSKAQEQLDSLKKILLPNHISSLIECLQYYNDKLFTYKIQELNNNIEYNNDPKIEILSINGDETNETNEILEIPFPDDLD